MKIIATKKATNQLQKVFKTLGEYGGIIVTDNPSTWWPLDVQVLSVYKNVKEVLIGIFQSFDDIDNYIVYDPCFHLILETDNNKIEEVQIKKCYYENLFGTFEIDDDNLHHSHPSFGADYIEKDKLGLKKHFSNFMNSMAEYGPYLKTTPLNILTTYPCTTEEMDNIKSQLYY